MPKVFLIVFLLPKSSFGGGGFCQCFRKMMTWKIKTDASSLSSTCELCSLGTFFKKKERKYLAVVRQNWSQNRSRNLSLCHIKLLEYLCYIDDTMLPDGLIKKVSWCCSVVDSLDDWPHGLLDRIQLWCLQRGGCLVIPSTSDFFRANDVIILYVCSAGGNNWICVCAVKTAGIES